MTNYKLKAFEAIAENAGDLGESYAANFCQDYDAGSTSYFCDAFSECADDYTSIYYYDIMEFIKENPDEVNAAIDEFGWDGCGRDIYKAGQAAEYNTIQRELYNYFDEIKAKLTCDMLDADEDSDDGETAQAWRKLSDDKQAELLDAFITAIEAIDHNDRLDAIADAFADYQEAIRAAAEDGASDD